MLQYLAKDILIQCDDLVQRFEIEINLDIARLYNQAVIDTFSGSPHDELDVQGKLLSTIKFRLEIYNIILSMAEQKQINQPFKIIEATDNEV